MKNRRGLTFIEIIVVISMLVILGSLVYGAICAIPPAEKPTQEYPMEVTRLPHNDCAWDLIKIRVDMVEYTILRAHNPGNSIAVLSEKRLDR